MVGGKERPARRTPRPEIRAAKDRAALEMSRGSPSRAFEVFVELCSAEPRDGQWPLKAGNALRSLNRQAARVCPTTGRVLVKEENR